MWHAFCIQLLGSAVYHELLITNPTSSYDVELIAMIYQTEEQLVAF